MQPGNTAPIYFAFAGGILRSPHGFDAQANVPYDLVDAGNVDGLVIEDGGLLSHYAGPEALQDFSERYHGLPRISVEVALKDIPSVLVDFSQGMHDVRFLEKTEQCRITSIS
jgi:hypothetical protein